MSTETPVPEIGAKLSRCARGCILLITLFPLRILQTRSSSGCHAWTMTPRVSRWMCCGIANLMRKSSLAKHGTRSQNEGSILPIVSLPT
jgi:hypothetical protein